jgi:hypothetical protein
MPRRDIIDEIKKRRARSGSAIGLSTYRGRFDSIDLLVDEIHASLKDVNQEIVRAIPIASIGALEAHFRICYATIINHSPTYLANAVRHAKEQNIRFDLELLVPLQGKKISIGEFLSHLFPINQLDDINQTLSSILEINFLSRHSVYDSESPHQFDNQEEQIKSQSCYAAVRRMFSLRHILAHEFALNLPLNKDEILEDYSSIKFFIYTATELIEKTLQIYVFPTQMNVNQFAGEQFEKSDNELQNLLERIKQLRTSGGYEFPIIEDCRRFDKAIRKWREFREAYGDSFSASYKGGSMQPAVHFWQLTTQTKYFIQNLEDEFRQYLEPL